MNNLTFEVIQFISFNNQHSAYKYLDKIDDLKYKFFIKNNKQTEWGVLLFSEVYLPFNEKKYFNSRQCTILQPTTYISFNNSKINFRNTNTILWIEMYLQIPTNKFIEQSINKYSKILGNLYSNINISGCIGKVFRQDKNVNNLIGGTYFFETKQDALKFINDSEIFYNLKNEKNYFGFKHYLFDSKFI